jgi:hypothetical protein
MKSDKVILVDADGVLLDWLYSFDNWMARHGYKIVSPELYKVADRFGLPRSEGKKMARMFNESAWIRKLPPHKDAIKYVRKLHEEHGYIFHVISSLSDDEYSQHLRTKNLRETFGNTVFEKYTYLDTGADKNEALAHYADSGCYWVEDKPENADVGIQMGLQSILMDHDHNKDYTPENGSLDKNVIRCENWSDVYNNIVGKF